MEKNVRKTFYKYEDGQMTTLRQVRRMFAWQHPGYRIIAARRADPTNVRNGFVVEFKSLV